MLQEQEVMEFQRLNLSESHESFSCFPLLRLKGNGEEEAELDLPTASRHLLLSLRSVNSMTNFHYGKLPEQATPLQMSCYNMEPGMRCDCETGLRNTLTKSQDYAMEEYGPEMHEAR
eukprot:762771-Hanusia_phi.AAC.2